MLSRYSSIRYLWHEFRKLFCLLFDRLINKQNCYCIWLIDRTVSAMHKAIFIRKQETTLLKLRHWVWRAAECTRLIKSVLRTAVFSGKKKQVLGWRVLLVVSIRHFKQHDQHWKEKHLWVLHWYMWPYIHRDIHRYF